MSAVVALPLIALIGGASAYYYFSPHQTVAPPPPPPRLENPGRLDPARPNPPTPLAPPAPLAPVAPLASPATPAGVDKIRSFIDQYDGGDCFFVYAVAISSGAVALEGFGTSTKPFTALDADFQRAIGFEADIGVRQVTQQQCPAISFLNRLRTQRSHAPRLDIDKDKLRNAELLGGTIDRTGDRNVDLILVSDTGMVQSLSHLLKPGVDAKTFKIGMQRTDGGSGRQPQLLIAISAASPLAALRPAQPVAADTFFRAALDEAAQSGQTLSATGRYFLLEK